MNIGKSGASHADWAISLGIFLVYILSMLMIIQPGAQPIYKEDRLLKIAKDNYKNSTSYSFYKTPLIIDTADLDFAGADTYTVRVEGDLPFAGDGNDFAVAIGVDGNLVPLDNFEIVLADGADRIVFISSVAVGKNTFYVISNARAVGVPDGYPDRGTVLPTDSYISDARLNFTLVFGSTEVLTGVDEAQLTAGSVVCAIPGHYAALKEAWAYPASKDFVTFYAGGSSPRYTALNEVCNQSQPYEQASVFVEEWATRLVNKTGVTEPIRMVVRVW
ncbi:MAG: hypothetical protein KJ955_07545 [Nanoarchaeota archaeon]|nr:hypothetical protein [Nanoarchaeota archaeon]